MGYLFVIVAIVIAVNFYMFSLRRKKSRGAAKRRDEERAQTQKRHEDLKRRLDYEQQDAARRIALRNKTFELYDIVRRQAEAGVGAEAIEEDGEE